MVVDVTTLEPSLRTGDIKIGTLFACIEHLVKLQRSEDLNTVLILAEFKHWLS